MEEDLLPASDQESIDIFFVQGAMPSSNKGSMRILYVEPLHVHVRKYFMVEHISEHTHFKVIILEGKMADRFLVQLRSKVN
jgi:hypothetical protein